MRVSILCCVAIAGTTAIHIPRHMPSRISRARMVADPVTALADPEQLTALLQSAADTAVSAASKVAADASQTDLTPVLKSTSEAATAVAGAASSAAVSAASSASVAAEAAGPVVSGLFQIGKRGVELAVPVLEESAKIALPFAQQCVEASLNGISQVIENPDAAATTLRSAVTTLPAMPPATLPAPDEALRGTEQALQSLAQSSTDAVQTPLGKVMPSLLPLATLGATDLLDTPTMVDAPRCNLRLCHAA